MRNFISVLLSFFIASVFIGCTPKQVITPEVNATKDMNQTKTVQVKPKPKPKPKPKAKPKPKPIEEPGPQIKEGVEKSDYYNKIFTKKDIAYTSQSIIFTPLKGKTRVVIYSNSLTDEGSQKCRFDEVVKFEKGKFYYEENGFKVTFALTLQNGNLNVSSNNKRLNFCKNGSFYGNYKTNLNFQNLITKYSFTKFSKDAKLSEFLKEFPQEQIQKGVGYPDKDGESTNEYYILDSKLEPLFYIIADKNDNIIELHVLSPIYKTPQGLSTASTSKDILNTIEVSRITSKEDKILMYIEGLGAKFEFDGSNLIGKKQHTIDTLSIDSPVSKIILIWDN
ncbi:hypothetical protein [Campylobacter sp.]|uniref:hypothetical protein n=1 Tax=Campylobacter sp. TaxID=205 RepID=UPI0026FF3231|nr:hypothetical protein [Campylobacter sp.]